MTKHLKLLLFYCDLFGRGVGGGWGGTFLKFVNYFEVRLIFLFF